MFSLRYNVNTCTSKRTPKPRHIYDVINPHGYEHCVCLWNGWYGLYRHKYITDNFRKRNWTLKRKCADHVILWYSVYAILGETCLPVKEIPLFLSCVKPKRVRADYDVYYIISQVGKTIYGFFLNSRRFVNYTVMMIIKNVKPRLNLNLPDKYVTWPWKWTFQNWTLSKYAMQKCQGNLFSYFDFSSVVLTASSMCHCYLQTQTTIFSAAFHITCSSRAWWRISASRCSWSLQPASSSFWCLSWVLGILLWWRSRILRYSTTLMMPQSMYALS